MDGRVAIPVRPRMRLPGQGHGAAWICQMWSTKSLSINTPRTRGVRAVLFQDAKWTFFPLDLKINNILAEQMEPTFLLKAYIFSCLVQ